MKYGSKHETFGNAGQLLSRTGYRDSRKGGIAGKKVEQSTSLRGRLEVPIELRPSFARFGGYQPVLRGSFSFFAARSRDMNPRVGSFGAQRCHQVAKVRPQDLATTWWASALSVVSRWAGILAWGHDHELDVSESGGYDVRWDATQETGPSFPCDIRRRPLAS